MESLSDESRPRAKAGYSLIVNIGVATGEFSCTGISQHFENQIF